MIERIFVLTVIVSSLPMGCSTNIYSPPSRINLMESSATLKEGENSGALAVGATGAVWGFGATHMTGTYRRGLSDELEVGVDANVVSVDDSNAAADVETGIYGGRMRAKWAPKALDGNVALTTGLGGGYNASGGGFVSPDLGVIAAIENRHLVPYIATSVFVSQPIAPKEVDVSVVNRDNGEDEPVGTRSDIAKLSWGYYINMGLKMPIHAQRLPAKSVRPLVNLYAGASVMDLRNEDGRAVGWGLMLGPEVLF